MRPSRALTRHTSAAPPPAPAAQIPAADTLDIYPALAIAAVKTATWDSGWESVGQGRGSLSRAAEGAVTAPDPCRGWGRSPLKSAPLVLFCRPDRV